jgi:hypothetical protein
MGARDYPDMDRSAAIRCLLGCGLERQRRRRSPQIRDIGSEQYRPEDNYHQSWLWYRRDGAPERKAPWKDNSGDCGRAKIRQHRYAEYARRVEQERMRLNGVAAMLKLLVTQRKKATAEAIAARLAMPDVYTVEFVERLLQRLKSDAHYDRPIRPSQKIGDSSLKRERII